MPAIEIPFTEQQLELIDRLAAERGTTREAVVAAGLEEAVRTDVMSDRGGTR